MRSRPPTSTQTSTERADMRRPGPDLADMLCDTIGLLTCTNADVRRSFGTVRHRSELTHSPSAMGSALPTAIWQPTTARSRPSAPTSPGRTHATRSARLVAVMPDQVTPSTIVDPPSLPSISLLGLLGRDVEGRVARSSGTAGVRTRRMVKFKKSQNCPRTHVHFLGGSVLRGTAAR